jgi:hypothetical protein
MDIHTSRSPRTTLAAAVEGSVGVTHLDSELCESRIMEVTKHVFVDTGRAAMGYISLIKFIGKTG